MALCILLDFEALAIWSDGVDGACTAESLSCPQHWQADAWYLRAVARKHTDPAGAVSDLSQAPRITAESRHCRPGYGQAISCDPQDAEAGAGLEVSAWRALRSQSLQAWKLRAEIQLRRGGSLALEPSPCSRYLPCASRQV